MMALTIPDVLLFTDPQRAYVWLVVLLFRTICAAQDVYEIAEFTQNVL